MLAVEVALSVTVGLCGVLAVVAAWRWLPGVIDLGVDDGDDGGGGGGGGEPNPLPVGPSAWEPVLVPDVSVDDVWRFSDRDLADIGAWLATHESGTQQASPVPT